MREAVSQFYNCFLRLADDVDGVIAQTWYADSVRTTTWTDDLATI